MAYELIPNKADCAGRQKEAWAIFAEARQAFAQRHWDDADEKFALSKKLLNGDGVSQFYLGLCKQYRAVPPPEGWSGTITMDEK